MTRESSFYDMCEPYDEVMADGGFTIAEDLILRRFALKSFPHTDFFNTLTDGRK